MHLGRSGDNASFWRGRRVLLTGHTGFKGSWLALWLEQLGAEIWGLALPPATTPNLFELLGPWNSLNSIDCDIRDRHAVKRVVRQARPHIVIHMAAQSLVRESYLDPTDTMMTNVIGTTHVLDALRSTPDLEATLVITSDKVYLNDDSGTPFDEDARLGGDDPYSASKAACELIATAMARSYSKLTHTATARAGNVIGGGDWNADRLVPDIWRAAKARARLVLRYPYATRPWQHVLDPLCGYLDYVKALALGTTEVPRSLNFGPDPGLDVTVEALVRMLSDAMDLPPLWDRADAEQPEEKLALRVNPSLAVQSLNWRPMLSIADTIKWTADWYIAHREGKNMRAFTQEQISRYEELRATLDA